MKVKKRARERLGMAAVGCSAVAACVLIAWIESRCAWQWHLQCASSFALSSSQPICHRHPLSVCLSVCRSARSGCPLSTRIMALSFPFPPPLRTHSSHRPTLSIDTHHTDDRRIALGNATDSSQQPSPCTVAREPTRAGRRERRKPRTPTRRARTSGPHTQPDAQPQPSPHAHTSPRMQMQLHREAVRMRMRPEAERRPSALPLQQVGDAVRTTHSQPQPQPSRLRHDGAEGSCASVTL